MLTIIKFYFPLRAPTTWTKTCWRESTVVVGFTSYRVSWRVSSYYAWLCALAPLSHGTFVRPGLTSLSWRPSFSVKTNTEHDAMLANHYSLTHIMLSPQFFLISLSACLCVRSIGVCQVVLYSKVQKSESTTKNIFTLLINSAHTKRLILYFTTNGSRKLSLLSKKNPKMAEFLTKRLYSEWIHVSLFCFFLMFVIDISVYLLNHLDMDEHNFLNIFVLSFIIFFFVCPMFALIHLQ